MYYCAILKLLLEICAIKDDNLFKYIYINYIAMVAILILIDEMYIPWPYSILETCMYILGIYDVGIMLQNLDALHDHLGTLYPGMRAPSFRCTERPEDGALILHYYSDRPGLEHIVIGIVKVFDFLWTFYINIII